jgi:hypothetical protein
MRVILRDSTDFALAGIGMHVRIFTALVAVFTMCMSCLSTSVITIAISVGMYITAIRTVCGITSTRVIMRYFSAGVITIAISVGVFG